MNKLIFTTILILTLSIFGHAQSKFPELDKAREIKLLQSNRKDVKRILKGFKHDKDEDNDYRQTFSTKNADIEITFSNAEDCSEEDSEKVWDVGEWQVTDVTIYVKTELRFENLRIETANFQKEQRYDEDETAFVYYNKDLGIAFEVNDDEIETILLFSPNGSQSLLCDNEETKDLKQFYSQEGFFITPLEERSKTGACTVPSVKTLTLSANEIIIGCNNAEEGKSCEESSREISVKTVEENIANDPITFMYKVSGGKIIGNGAEVTWDLTEVESGTYTITAGANNGCGWCGQTKTETVVIKECADCLPK